jgi:eukaryotic-like serine/threonine-protein kinase
MDASLLKTALLDPARWQQINSYLDQLLDLEPDSRDRWLADLTTTQPFIATVLGKLLATPENDVGRFLEGTPLVERELAGLQASMAGKQIGPYTIERLIGRGGMGAVWLARRSDGRFEAHYAIKFIDSLNARPDLVGRFSREGRLLARLSHPNIARLIDAGTFVDGRQYLVLEYIDGERIDQYCRSKQLSTASRVRLFLDAVAAVAHAHSHLVIHRDLKPSNVLVTGAGTVKLLDFGVAKLLSPEDITNPAMHTQIEDSALTPEFAAPEQLLGDVPSTATDVYQLGMLLYVLLTDGHPLQLMGNRGERIKAALAGRIGPASQFASGAALRKELAGDLDAILAKALDSDATQRYPTAAALHEELVRYLNREPVSARRGVRLYQMRRFVSRHRLAVALSTVAIVALLALAVFAFEQAHVATRERDQAVALASRNNAVSDFLDMLITEAAEADHVVTVRDMIARSERLALLDSSGNKENRAAVLDMLARRYESLDDRGKAAELTERALGLLQNSPASSLRSTLRCGYALIISGMDRNDEGMRILAEELEHPPADPGALSECLASRAQLAYQEGDADGGLDYALQALAAARSGGELSAVSEANALDTVAFGYRVKGRQDEALRYSEMSLEKLVQVGREWSPGGLVARNNYGYLLESAGVPKRALQTYDEILAVLAERDPTAEPPVYLLVNRGRSLESSGRFDEARVSLEHGLQNAQATENADALVLCLSGLSRIATQMGDLVAAEEYLSKARPLVSSPLQFEKFPTVPLAVGSLALAKGSLDEAGRQFDQAALNKSNDAAVIYGKLGKAEVELRVGDPAAAERDAQVALDTSKASQAGLPHSQLTGRSWLMLGRALQARGQGAQAHKAFENAVSDLSNTVDNDHPLLVQARRLIGQPGA